MPPAAAPAHEAQFPPDFCTARAVFLVVMAGELLALVLALAGTAQLEQFWTALAFNSLFVQWVALGTAATLCLARPQLRDYAPHVSALICYGASLLITLVCSLVTSAVVEPAGLGWAADNPYWALEFAARNLAIAAIVGSVVFRYLYVQHQWRTQVEAEARSRIQALQARIRPHFLFNSMNTIANLTRTRPDLAETAVEDLADLFRATLAERERISVAQELEVVRRSLSIESLRLGPRLKVCWALADNLPEELAIPALILQPLVENAIYHGIEPRTEGGEVRIAVGIEDGALQFLVGNPLPEGTAASRPGNRMAQDNVRQRLDLAYGARAEMRVQRDAERYEIVLRIPLEYAGEDV
jgi:two-component system sensor histidine kinase AlgZ